MGYNLIEEMKGKNALEPTRYPSFMKDYDKNFCLREIRCIGVLAGHENAVKGQEGAKGRDIVPVCIHKGNRYDIGLIDKLSIC